MHQISALEEWNESLMKQIAVQAVPTKEQEEDASYDPNDIDFLYQFYYSTLQRRFERGDQDTLQEQEQEQQEQDNRESAISCDPLSPASLNDLQSLRESRVPLSQWPQRISRRLRSMGEAQ